MRYIPGPTPEKVENLPQFIRQELNRISDAQGVVLYRENPSNASLSAGISADWKIAAGNVVRLSTSAATTLTGLSVLSPANRELVLINVGHGIVVLKSQDSASAAAYRFALVGTLELSANAAVSLWYDAQSARWRAIGRT
jgi:hypothetical protein